MEWCDAGSLSDALQDGRLQVSPDLLLISCSPHSRLHAHSSDRGLHALRALPRPRHAEGGSDQAAAGWLFQQVPCRWSTVPAPAPWQAWKLPR